MLVIPKKFPSVKSISPSKQREIFRTHREFIVRPDADKYTPIFSSVMEKLKEDILTVSFVKTVGELTKKFKYYKDYYSDDQYDDLIIIDGIGGYAWYYKSLYHPDIYKNDNLLMWVSNPPKHKDDPWYTEAVTDDGEVVFKMTYDDEKGITFLTDVRSGNIKYTIPDEINAVSGYISRNKGYNLADKLNDNYHKFINH